MSEPTDEDRDCEAFHELLKDSRLWQQTILNVGIITGYATKFGLVVLLEQHDGWMMLTECPLPEAKKLLDAFRKKTETDDELH